MESENIIAVNIPNTITITLMAVAGGLMVGFIGMLIKRGQGG